MTVAPADFRLTPPRASRKWRPNHEHDDLQAAAVDFMRMALPREAIVFSCPNGGFRIKTEAARLKRCGLLAGVADILAIVAGRVYCVEIKAGRDTPSPAQIDFQASCHRAGVPYAVVRSLGEVEAALRSFGLPVRGRVAA